MDHNYYQHTASIQDKHWWYEARRRLLKTLLKNLNQKAPVELLEAGCGCGSNLKTLQEFGSVDGFELFSDAATYSQKQNADTTILTGSLPDNIPFEKTYDIIGAFDVIEHIDDDIASLKSLGKHLKPQGHLIVTVPAYQWLWSQHDEINHHKRRYNKTSLKHAIEAAGLEIHKLSYYNCFLFPLALAFRGLEQVTKKQPSETISLPKSNLTNTLLMKIFESEKYLLPHINLPFGLSLIAIATHKQK